MTTTSDMMKTMSVDMQGVDMQLMQDCIEACTACMQACTMCADADATDGADMARCASLCASTADMCSAMMMTMMRPAGFDREGMMSMLSACMTMCRACADECNSHDMDHCRMCAQVCTNCADACEKLMASMG